MNEITQSVSQLPDNIEDLSKFVLVNEERLQALRAEIRAINKVNLAKRVYEQKLAEAQEIGQVTVEAAQKMGELLLKIQKQSGARVDLTSPTDSERLKTKTQITSEMGMTTQQVSQYQQMAQNPEAVQIAIQKAIERGDVVSRTQVMKEIKAIKEELAEKEQKIQELENKEPQIKEVIKEVVPKDYERVKRDAKNFESDFKHMQKAYEEMAEKWKQESIKNEQMIAKESEPEEKRKRELKLSAAHFVKGIHLFLEEYGGYTYLMSELDDLDKNERELVKRSVSTIQMWADEMLNTTVTEVI